MLFNVQLLRMLQTDPLEAQRENIMKLLQRAELLDFPEVEEECNKSLHSLDVKESGVGDLMAIIESNKELLEEAEQQEEQNEEFVKKLHSRIEEAEQKIRDICAEKEWNPEEFGVSKQKNP